MTMDDNTFTGADNRSCVSAVTLVTAQNRNNPREAQKIRPSLPLTIIPSPARAHVRGG
jgi:hypothetical protein